MIKLEIGSSGWHDLSDVRESWITQQIHERTAAGLPVCVQVRIECDHARVTFATAGCGAGGGGRGPATTQECEVLELWDHFGLGNGQFTGGQLIAFLRRAERMCV